jgi:tRNA pseudouridine55 synthase
MRLGVETTTLDAEGEVVAESPVTASEADVRAAMRALVGESLQRPPAYSAVKVGGRKLYEAARAGEQLEAEPRPIRVDAFELTSFDPPDLTFRVTCSAGTYVRVLAADVGSALNTGAHLTALRRTAIGPFLADDAVSPDRPGEPLPIETAVRHLPRFDLDPDEAVAASHGRPLGPAGLPGPYAVFDPEARLIGVYADDGPRARPQVILARV